MAGRTRIGIEVGASSVRAAEVLMRDGAPVLRRIGQEALPEGAVEAGAVHDAAAVTAAVRKLWKELGFSHRRVSLSVSSPHVAVRSFSVPPMERAELLSALPFLARDVVPIPMDRAIVDFVETGWAEKEDKRTGLLVAIPTKGVLSIIRAVEAAKLVVQDVDFAPLSAARVIRLDPNGTQAVIDFGATMTSIAVFAKGVPVMVRLLSHGADEVTIALTERLGVTRAEAEDLKRRHGLGSGERAIGEVIGEALRPLFAEIRSSLGYYRSGNPEQPVESILGVGGGSFLPNLLSTLAQGVGIGAQHADPFAGFHLDRGADSAELAHRKNTASALGAALPGGENAQRNSVVAA